MIEPLVERFPALRRVPPPAYAVGGAIRDFLLRREPLDVDVVCDAPERCASAVSDRVIRLGREEDFEAWRVVVDEKIYDFTRRSGASIEEDLKRRDFTINAIALDLESGGLLDPFGGRADIERRIVRMIRPENFDHDPLRILKGVRMAVTLGFAIEPQTLEEMRRRAAAIERVAVERVTYELTVIFSARAARRALDLLHRTQLDGVLFGSVARDFKADDVSVTGAFALLVDNPDEYASHWRWSDTLRRDVLTLQRLVREFDVVAIYDAGEAVARQLPAVLRALGRDDDAARAEHIAKPELFETRALLDGDEIASLTGLTAGPQLGKLKRALLEAQLRGEVKTRDEATDFVR